MMTMVVARATECCCFVIIAESQNLAEPWLSQASQGPNSVLDLWCLTFYVG